jgi:hypothetical protein
MSRESAVGGIRALKDTAPEQTAFDDVLTEHWQDCPLLEDMSTAGERGLSRRAEEDVQTQEPKASVSRLTAACGTDMVEGDAQAKPISIGGLIIGVVLTVLGVATVVEQSLSGKMPLRVPEAGIAWIAAGIAISVRSYQPPIGWRKGLATFFGGLFLGASILPISMPLRHVGYVDTGAVGAFLIFMILGVLLIVSGFKKTKAPFPRDGKV